MTGDGDMAASAELERRIQLVIARAERAARRIAGEAALPPPPEPGAPAPGTPGHALALALRLTSDELDLVWSVVARAIEPRVAAHARAAFGVDARLGLSLAQYAAWSELFAERCRALLGVLDPRHALRTSGILIPNGDPPHDVSTPWTTSPRVCDFLRGADRLDPLVESLGGVVRPGRMIASAEQRAALAQLRAWLASSAGATILVEGASGTGRRTVLAVAAAPRKIVAVDLSRVAPRQVEAVLEAVCREALLVDAVPVLANLDELWARLPPDDEILLRLAARLDSLEGPLAITTSSPAIDLRARRRILLRVRWPRPDAATRLALWTEALGDPDPAAELDLIAHRYELGAGGIATAARSAQHHAAHRGRDQPVFADLVAGIRDNVAERLGDLARRVEVTQDWSELVLPPETREDVQALIGRIRHAHLVLDRWGFRRKLARGAGVAALFSGPPGTGKTMVAGLIARELQLELYQVDLSRIVSKWVGETEKQLARVFEAAEAGHALLLFDEADALFAKRSAEVKSAVDRYANLEVNYLLQRVESFGGVVILTTNLDASLDPALRRRLASHIVFAPPERDERLELWRGMLATGAPLDPDLGPNLCLERLADELPAMTGANIRNATLTAAFLAAEDGAPIGAAHLARGARSEYRAMGHLLAQDQRAGRR